MADRPLLFKGRLVRAILAGTKTVTRRVVTPRLPGYQAGDRIYVRETWGSLEADHPLCPGGRKPRPGDRLVYRANPADDYQWGPGRASQSGFVWRPSIHMPKWASRIWLDVVDVRDEPLQEVTELDALAEGVEGKEVEGVLNGVPGTYIDGSARDEFARLWDSINAPRGFGWADNPTVRRIEFRRLDQGTLP